MLDKHDICQRENLNPRLKVLGKGIGQILNFILVAFLKMRKKKCGAFWVARLLYYQLFELDSN